MPSLRPPETPDWFADHLEELGRSGAVVVDVAWLKARARRRQGAPPAWMRAEGAPEAPAAR